MHTGRGGPPFPRMGHQHEDPAREKALRSIFVANIAFETNEEQLKSVLSEVGPVVNLKLIYDPATGKPRGFGFCEYQDAETAMSAVRNLAGREVNGRPLRIDSATNAPGENFRAGANLGSGQPGPVEPPLHGPPVPPEAAPEAITKAVASLPPEQMFELMKQMKWCIQHNPEEAEQLLMHNPQLAYALLQAQVVMRIVDLETAQKMLHRSPRGPSLLQPEQPQRAPPHPPSHPLPPPPAHGREPSYGPREQHYGPPHGERYGGPQQPPAMGPPGPHRQGPPPPQMGYGPRPPPSDLRPGPPPPHSSQSPAQDQEKAALIMQVLSLTDEQIQLLPPEQRNSIIKLKEQIARSGTR